MNFTTFCLYFVMILLSLILGYLIGRRSILKHSDGTLRIERVEYDEETTERYSLDFETSLDDVPKKRVVIFRVEAKTSRESSSL